MASCSPVAHARASSVRPSAAAGARPDETGVTQDRGADLPKSQGFGQLATDHHPRGRGMHAIDIAMRDGDASWCACTCGWVSEKVSEDDAAALWAAHVVEDALTTTSHTEV